MNSLRLLVLLTLFLSVVCNAELRTWTAVNGKEVEAEFVSNEKGIVKLKLKSGKVFEVPAKKLSKKDNEFISSLAKPEGVNSDELEEREGIIYLKGSETPYTGKVFDLWKNGKKRWEANYKDGKKEGLEVQCYENGQKRVETNSKDGMDKITFWYKNGQKEGEENYKDGAFDGLQTRWHENGKKKWEANYKDGGPVDGSEKFWNSTGEPVDSMEEAEK